MTVWTVLAIMAVGYLLRMAFETPNRFHDVDELVARRKDALRNSVRDS